MDAPDTRRLRLSLRHRALGPEPHYNYLYLHVIAHNLAPTQGQLMKGVFVALGITLVLSVAVHLLSGWLFSILRRRDARSHDPSGGPIGPQGVLPGPLGRRRLPSLTPSGGLWRPGVHGIPS